MWGVMMWTGFSAPYLVAIRFDRAEAQALMVERAREQPAMWWMIRELET